MQLQGRDGLGIQHWCYTRQWAEKNVRNWRLFELIPHPNAARARPPKTDYIPQRFEKTGSDCRIIRTLISRPILSQFRAKPHVLPDANDFRGEWTGISILIPILLATPARDTETQTSLRVASDHASLYGKAAGDVQSRLQDGMDTQAERTAAIVHSIRPDILLINENP
jgi:hypothetical protein